MKKHFKNIKLSYRLFIIIIVFILIPYLVLFFYSNRRAEIIIKEKALEVGTENIKQVGKNIEDYCINIIKASDYLVSLDNYKDLCIKNPVKDYDYLKSYKTINELIQNVNNSLLNSHGDINILSKNELLYSTLPEQKFRYHDFYQDQIEKGSFFSNVHSSYRNFEKDQKYISCIRKLPDFCSDTFYLVISIPVVDLENSLNTVTGSMNLLDSLGDTICSAGKVSSDEQIIKKHNIPAADWVLVSTISTASLYKDWYELRSLIIIISLILTLLCLIVSFYAISFQLTPLSQLKEQMGKVIHGNLDVEVKTNGSQDEIGILANIFNEMVHKLKKLIQEIKDKQERENALQYEMLLAQINPHFLFNTLNSIKWMSVAAHTDNITSSITSLGRLLEISMNKINDILPIQEELTNIKSYVQLQKIRYPGRFEVIYDIDEEILSSYTLKLILQPLVENAIIHNIDFREFLSIKISGETKDRQIYLRVIDNGRGISKDKLQKILQKDVGKEQRSVFRGIGISNVQERIQLAYGDKYGLSFQSDEQVGTEVTIIFPNKKQPNIQIPFVKENYDKNTDSR
ncbi:MAG TPA: histidine kinase [Candidatus Merdenecus merdavium]|nr:histidine kinase [Candidatus Merdenecus merdavium]